MQKEFGNYIDFTIETYKKQTRVELIPRITCDEWASTVTICFSSLTSIRVDLLTSILNDSFAGAFCISGIETTPNGATFSVVPVVRHRHHVHSTKGTDVVSTSQHPTPAPKERVASRAEPSKHGVCYHLWCCCCWPSLFNCSCGCLFCWLLLLLLSPVFIGLMYTLLVMVNQIEHDNNIITRFINGTI